MSVSRLISSAFIAWRTLDPEDWSRFASQWLTLVERLPRSAWAWRIAGHALIAGERFREACQALETAIHLAPNSAKSFLLLGRAWKALGQRPAALASFERAWQLGAHQTAGRALCRYGARSLVPAILSDTFPIHDYPSFIASHPVEAPPETKDEFHFRFLIDARESSSTLLAATLSSLSNQTHGNWTGEILAGLDRIDVDERCTFRNDAFNVVAPHIWVIHLSPGIILTSTALSWLAYAIAISDCEAVFADHDHYQMTGQEALTRSDPVLHPMADEIWFENYRNRPLLLARRMDPAYRREPDALPFEGCSIAHVPRILASSLNARQSAEVSPRCGGIGKISVIIPTRDNPVLLARCMETLKATAGNLDRIEFLIVDNGSVLADTKHLLDEFRRSDRVRIVAFPERFNWSRANNLAVAEAHGEHLLFLNDDTEMITHNWDSLVSGLLEHDPRNGILGVRMLYPDGAIQHAGFVFGLDIGPEHEGRWRPGNDRGPCDRWTLARQAPAVTGAFMAMRRAVYDQVGPFDEVQYAIDFSDIDICLRVREAGYRVIYLPEISIVHHESVSRGHNRSRVKKRRARSEQARLRASWGNALDHDPGYNPYWSRNDYAFDGYREPPLDEITEHIKMSAGLSPWALIRSTPLRLNDKA